MGVVVDGEPSSVAVIVEERKGADGIVELPVLLRSSASVPTAVLSVPVMLSNSAASAHCGIIESPVLRTASPHRNRC